MELVGWLAMLLGLGGAATAIFVTRWEHISIDKRVTRLENWRDREDQR